MIPEGVSGASAGGVPGGGGAGVPTGGLTGAQYLAAKAAKYGNKKKLDPNNNLTQHQHFYLLISFIHFTSKACSSSFLLLFF